MRRESRPIAGSPNIVIKFERFELVRSPPLTSTLGESHFKLKMMLQGRKFKTLHNIFGATEKEIAESEREYQAPIIVNASSNLHKMLRVELQTNRLSRMVAFLRLPLRSLELLARVNRSYTFTLSGKDGLAVCLAHCHLSVKLNLSAEEVQQAALVEELERWNASELELLASAGLCQQLSRCFQTPVPRPPPLLEVSQTSGRRKKTVSMAPDVQLGNA